MRTDVLFPAAPGRMLLLATLLSGALVAQAAEPSAVRPSDALGTADSLAKIENETLLLKAQERQMAVRLQLAAQRGDLAQRHAHTRNLERPARAGDPTVVAVEGIGRSPHVTLMMDNGGVLEAGIGEILPNGMTVLSVRAGEVVVLQGRKERIRLAHAVPVAPPAVGAPPAPAAAARAPWTLPPLLSAQAGAQ